MSTGPGPNNPLGQYSFLQIVIGIVIFAAIVGILFVVLGVFGVAIPPWVITIFWICVTAMIAILAIKFIASLF